MKKFLFVTLFTTLLVSQNHSMDKEIHKKNEPTNKKTQKEDNIDKAFDAINIVLQEYVNKPYQKYFYKNGKEAEEIKKTNKVLNEKLEKEEKGSIEYYKIKGKILDIKEEEKIANEIFNSNVIFTKNLKKLLESKYLRLHYQSSLKKLKKTIKNIFNTTDTKYYDFIKNNLENKTKIKVGFSNDSTEKFDDTLLGNMKFLQKSLNHLPPPADKELVETLKKIIPTIKTLEENTKLYFKAKYSEEKLSKYIFKKSKKLDVLLKSEKLKKEEKKIISAQYKSKMILKIEENKKEKEKISIIYKPSFDAYKIVLSLILKKDNS